MEKLQYSTTPSYSLSPLTLERDSDLDLSTLCAIV